MVPPLEDTEGAKAPTGDDAQLRAVPLFADLDDAALSVLSAMVVRRRVPKGACLISHRDAGRSLFLLVKGRVKVSVASIEGRELALSYLEAPTHFGEMSLVDAGPRSADVVALTDVDVLVLDAADLSGAIRLQPKLALMLIAGLSRRLRQANARLEDLSFHDAPHRVMRVLLSLSASAYEVGGVPAIVGTTHHEIGTLASTSRETVSRVISSLVAEGVVATKGRRIIVDPIALRAKLG